MIKIFVKGLEQFTREADRLADLKKRMPLKIERIANRFALRVVRTSKEKYLSGPRPEKLGVGTGHLRSSIRAVVERKDNSVDIRVGTDVPYARIHEEGGKTPAHLILPKKAGGVLTFMKNGRRIFVKMVHHPGSNIRKRPFLHPAVEDNLGSLKRELSDLFGPGGEEGALV